MARNQSVDMPTSRTNPRWLGDYSTPELAIAHFPAKVDAAQFTDADVVTVTVSGPAALGATSLPVTAITLPAGVSRIPAGTLLYFGADESAVLTADYTGGTTMTVAALPAALEGGETATYNPNPGRLYIQAGTLLGRTYAERDAGTGFGPAAAADDEFFILLFEITDANRNADATLVRSGRAVTIKENLLPQWTAISGNAGLLAKLRAEYQCIKGA